MLAIEKRKDHFKKLSKRNKIQLILAGVFTILVVAALPVLAWFTNTREATTVAKINSPAKLSIKAGKAEDIIQFKLAGIDVGEGDKPGSRDFVFCVEGEDISSYNLQLAHTTNINFTYTLYKAHTDNVNGSVSYIDLGGNEIRYTKAFEFTTEYGDYINKGIDSSSGRKIGTDNYSVKSYENGESKQKFAEPLYWQTKDAVEANDKDGDIAYNEYNSVYGVTDDKKFLNFYILNVSWEANEVSNDKETDILYITAQVS